MPVLRPYVDGDWQAVLDLCQRALAPACHSLEHTLGAGLDWKACIESHLRSLTAARERRRLVVATLHGSVVGVAHYQVDRESRSGRIGLSAVRPERQGEGIGPLMFERLLEAMRAEGLKFATADTGGDPASLRVRRAYEKVGFVALPMVHYYRTLGDSGGGPRRSGRGPRGKSGPQRIGRAAGPRRKR